MSYIRYLCEIKELGDNMNMRCNGLENQINQLRQDVLETAPEIVYNKLSDNLQINGAVGMTREQLTQILNSALQNQHDSIMERFNRIESTQNIQPLNSELNYGQFNRNGWKLYLWNERFHIIPRDFVFPKSTSARTMWNLWHYGNSGGGVSEVGPYKWLCCKEDYMSLKAVSTDAKGSQQRFSRAKLIMVTLIQLGKTIQESGHALIPLEEDEIKSPSISHMDTVQSDALFIRLYKNFCMKYIYKRYSSFDEVERYERPFEVGCCRLANALCSKKRRNDELNI